MYRLLLVLVVLVYTGCEQKEVQIQEDVEDSTSVKSDHDSADYSTGESKFNPFVVYKDKGLPFRFTPSGYMPDGQCLTLNDVWQENCHEGKSCIKVIYDIPCSLEGRQWAGIYWLNPPDNWGDRKGGYNLTGAQRLVFWAKGEKGAEVIEEFKVGGVGSMKEYPDSDSASIGPVILMHEWREYIIDLRGKDLSYISGGFAWVANVNSNPEACTFYLDNIRFE